MTLTKVRKRLQKISDTQVVLIALALGAFVRFLNMAKGSIWHDEGYTMMLAPQSPAQIIARTARDVHPPLYYITLHYWMKVFGSSEVGARSLSAVAMLGVVIIGFLLVRELFGRPAARLSALFLALGPFLVRYSQEARMYGLAAFFAILATYLLVMALKKDNNKWWIGYSLSIAAGLYTHYYIVFIVLLHWIYVLVSRKPKVAIKNRKWWFSNIASAALFAPWLPSAYHQFTRVQAGFWIAKPTALTLPSTLAQFLTFTDLGAIGNTLRLLTFVAFLALVVWFAVRREYWPKAALIAGLTFLAPMVVLVLSLKRPIYVDRYFVFAAAGFYMLLAILLYTTKPWQHSAWLRITSIVILVGIFSVGIINVYSQATHRMKLVGEYVNQRYQPGDGLISGELYTYFDFSYYNHTGVTAQLLAPGGVNGYGESSLLYDRSAQIVVRHFSDMHPATGRVWVIGKPGNNGDFKVPANWKELEEYQISDSKVERFQILPQG